MPLVKNSPTDLLVGKEISEVEHFEHGVYLYCTDGTKIYLYPSYALAKGVVQAAKDDS